VSTECGYVVVPENRALPWNDDNTVRLAVTILRAPGVRSPEPPTFLLGGGPGQDVIALFENLIQRYQSLLDRDITTEEYPGHRRDAHEFKGVMDLLVADLSKRELVLFDQRGAGYSLPSLRCQRESWVACRRRLNDAGVDVPAYNTLENAADVNDIRRALGFGHINLHGGSYGTRLGLEVMRQYPTVIRAAVLDGVAPPQVAWPVEMARRYGDALHVLFDHCRTDPSCAAAFPDLEVVFYRLVERLQAQPIRIRVRGEDRSVDGDDLHSIVWNSLFDLRRIRFLPLMIGRLADGNPAVLTRMLADWPAGDPIAWGMHYSVDCAERWVFAKPSDVVAAARGVHPAIRQGVVREFTSTFAICRDWNVPAARPEVHTPVRSDIQALLLSGEFDPGTPPGFAELAAATLSRHYRYVLPHEGHTDGFVSLCHSSLASAFLDDPSRPPDTACIAGMAASPFVLR
jgi:pimeloyl-ACP methyl ester carboxylesterase